MGERVSPERGKNLEREKEREEGKCRKLALKDILNLNHEMEGHRGEKNRYRRTVA